MTILLRVNLDIKGSRKDENSLRFRAALESVKSLRSGKNKLVIVSHRGRPEGIDPKLSLKPVARLFEKALKKKIRFFKDFDFTAMREEITSAKPGTIFMLENIRFLAGEQENDPKLAKALAGLADEFVNDDFATAHRENASNAGITKFLPHRMGKMLTREIAVLSKVMAKPRKPLVLVIGGAKISDKMGVIENLKAKADFILLGGGPANTVMAAQGCDIGGSISEPSMAKMGAKLGKSRKVMLPVDFAVEKERILDIGPETIAQFCNILKKAGTIVWGGPMGAFEKEGFERGSYAIARCIAASKAFSVIGGGETGEIINDLGLVKKVDLLSTGGGAMLEYLSGKRLPALEALKK